MHRSLLFLLVSGCSLSTAVVVGATAPQATDLSGTWNTHWGSEYIAVVFMKQEGDLVTASYATTAVTEAGAGTIEGSFEGRLEGNELTGTWNEGGTRFGRFRFMFDPQRRSFTGTWGRAGDDHDGGHWDGSR